MNFKNYGINVVLIKVVFNCKSKVIWYKEILETQR